MEFNIETQIVTNEIRVPTEVTASIYVELFTNSRTISSFKGTNLLGLDLSNVEVL